tara:strand:+ start:430 stop:603 length:174 start_codon:yes stop_codon:yes gene_type:complete
MSEEIFYKMLDGWLKAVREDKYTGFDAVDFQTAFIGDEKDGEVYIKFTNVRSSEGEA